MDFRNTLIHNSTQTYLYDGARWTTPVAPILDLTFLPGYTYTIQSIEVSFLSYFESATNKVFTDARVSGWVMLSILNQLDTITLSNIIFQSTVPLCRYWKDVPYIEFRQQDISAIRITSEKSPIFSAIDVLLDSTLGATVAIGDYVNVLFRLQIGFVPTPVLTKPQDYQRGTIKGTLNYKRERALVSRD